MATDPLDELLALVKSIDGKLDEIQDKRKELTDRDVQDVRRQMVRAGLDPTTAEAEWHRVRAEIEDTSAAIGQAFLAVSALRSTLEFQKGYVVAGQREQRRRASRRSI
jgi:chromosome segregation ATPase